MTNLARLQWDFQEFLLRGSNAVQAHVVGTDCVPASVRLGIYGHAYSARLIEALQSNYPAIAKLLGEQDFAELARGYIATHDSRFFSIRYYGHALAHYVANEPRYRPVPFLADLARWEWTMAEVFDSADAPPLDMNALAHKAPADWASMRLTFHPSVRLLSLSWNAPSVWKALMNDMQRPRATTSREPKQWLLWRQDLREYYRQLTPSDAHALSAARSGESFGEICIAACEQVGEDEAPARAAELLRGWIEAGLITGLS